jgi:hypothetical protein
VDVRPRKHVDNGWIKDEAQSCWRELNNYAAKSIVRGWLVVEYCQRILAHSYLYTHASLLLSTRTYAKNVHQTKPTNQRYCQ